jgi:hypothetical protein
MFYIVAIFTYICFFLTVYAEVSLCRHDYVYAPGHVTLYVFFYWGAGGGVALGYKRWVGVGGGGCASSWSGTTIRLWLT